MRVKKSKKQIDRATLAAVKREMNIPRFSTSARRGIPVKTTPTATAREVPAVSSNK